MSNPLAGVCSWKVCSASTAGRDHYPVLCVMGERVEVRQGGGISKWIYGRADWGKFQELCEKNMKRVDFSGDV